MMELDAYPARYWHRIEDGRVQCDLCPRDCKLHEGQRGACFVRMRENDRILLTTYGRLNWTPNLRQVFKWDTVQRNG